MRDDWKTVPTTRRRRSPRWRGVHRVIPAAEGLERRDVPAVGITLSAGVLTIQGDSWFNNASVTARELGRDQYLVGDWDGNGKDELAVRRGDEIHIQSAIGKAGTAQVVKYGNGDSEDQYLVGDWNGDGKDELAVRRGLQVLYQGKLTDTRAAGTASYGNGSGEDQYLVGDWNGDGKDELAVRRGFQVFYQGKLSDTKAAGTASYGNGNSENQYLAGDWDGNGKDELAVRRGGKVLYQGKLPDTKAAGTASYGNGAGEDQYLVGDWNGNRRAELAVRRNAQVVYQGAITAASGATVSFGNGNAKNLDLSVVVSSQPSAGFWFRDEVVTRRFDGLAVSRILFEGGKGDDGFVNRTAIPSSAQGGEGDDSLTGGDGDDTLYGGIGVDVVDGGAGTDRSNGSARDRMLNCEIVTITNLPGGSPQSSNTCGPNSAWRVINALGGLATLQEVIDRASEGSLISRWNLGTTGATLVDAMNSLRRGLSGVPSFSLKTDSNLDRILSALREGRPVVAMVRVSGNDSLKSKFLPTLEIPRLHWIALDGFDSVARKITYTETDGNHYSTTYSDFEARFNWDFGGVKNLALKGLGVVNGTFIV